MNTKDGDEKTCYSPSAAGKFPKVIGHLGCHPSFGPFGASISPGSIFLEDSESVSTTIFCYCCMYYYFRLVFAFVCTCVYMYTTRRYITKKSTTKKLADWKLLTKTEIPTRRTVCTRGSFSSPSAPAHEFSLSWRFGQDCPVLFQGTFEGIDTFSVLARSLSHTLTPTWHNGHSPVLCGSTQSWYTHAFKCDFRAFSQLTWDPFRPTCYAVHPKSPAWCSSWKTTELHSSSVFWLYCWSTLACSIIESSRRSPGLRLRPSSS